MASHFNADEVFEMAERIEANGAAFYRKAADEATDGAVRDLLNRLAEMEDRHRRIFSDMRDAWRRRSGQAEAFDPDGQVVAYLRTLVDGRLFNRPPVDFNSLRSVLETALNTEKESILFYLGMKKVVPESLGRSELEKIIREEMTHVTLLGKEMAQLV